MPEFEASSPQEGITEEQHLNQMDSPDRQSGDWVAILAARITGVGAALDSERLGSWMECVRLCHFVGVFCSFVGGNGRA